MGDSSFSAFAKSNFRAPEIAGGSDSHDFVLKTQQALDLLMQKSPEAYIIISRYIGVIRKVDRGSGMDAAKPVPVYNVGIITAFAFRTITWYASTIAHDAYHSKLYHEYKMCLGRFPSNASPSEKTGLWEKDESIKVPENVWKNKEAEIKCLNFQKKVLSEIGGTAEELAYVRQLIISSGKKKGTKYWDEERYW